MTAPRVLFDDPGPRGRRRIALGTVITVVVIATVVVLALRQLAINDQLHYAMWKPFWQQWAVLYFLQGLRGTLEVTLVAALVSFPAGTLLAVGRLSRLAPLRWLCTAYIEIFRSVPTLLLVYVFLFALPGFGLNLGTFGKLTVPIVIINAAVIAEIVRAGVNALDHGQSEAAAAIGMTRGLALRTVVLPQAVRLVIPSLVTQLVAILKDSTLGYVVSYPELMKQANNLANNTKLLLQAFVVVSLIYIVINFALTRLAAALEVRLRRRGLGGRPGSPQVGNDLTISTARSTAAGSATSSAARVRSTVQARTRASSSPAASTTA